MVLPAIKVVNYIFSMLRISLAGFPKKWSANEAQFTWPCPLWGSPRSFPWPTPQLGSDPALSLQWGSWALHLHKKKKKQTQPTQLPCTVASPSLLTSSTAPLYHLFNPNLSSVFEVFAAKWRSRICSQCKHIKNGTLLLYGAGSLPPTCSPPLTTTRWTKVWLPSFAIHLDFF